MWLAFQRKNCLPLVKGIFREKLDSFLFLLEKTVYQKSKSYGQLSVLKQISLEKKSIHFNIITRTQSVKKIPKFHHGLFLTRQFMDEGYIVHK